MRTKANISYVYYFLALVQGAGEIGISAAYNKERA